MTGKRCSKCREVQSLDSFNRNNRKRDGLHSWCRKCMNENGQQRIKLGRHRNVKAKLDRKVCWCHGLEITMHNINTFEWNHRDPSTKKFVVGQMLLRSDDLYFAEIEKCDLVCRSWHIQHTRLQRESGAIRSSRLSEALEGHILIDPQRSLFHTD